MKLNTSILPLRIGASATLELSEDGHKVVLLLQSPFGRKQLQLRNTDLNSVPKGGFPNGMKVVEVGSWEKGDAVDYRRLSKDGTLNYQFALGISIDDSAMGTYPHIARAEFEILADQWEHFFNPETFKETA
jgi:hypothetical protein